MNKINEKTFKMLKVCVLSLVIFISGIYYVFYVDKKINLNNENKSSDFDFENKEIKNYEIQKIITTTENNEVDIILNINEEKYNDKDFIDDISVNNSETKNIIEKNSDVNSNKININTATKEELITIKNIGPVVATNIINYRKENGKFTDIEDIKNVKGIGEVKFNIMKEHICIN